MTNEINDIEKARRKKRDKSGWSIEEIKKIAQQERAAHKKLCEQEPDALVSGKDMDKILEEDDNEKDD
jgi:hypothetical protein